MNSKGRLTGSKGVDLELRVARLLIAEGMSPFLNVYFRNDLDPRNVNHPDVDVLGCRALPDATLFYTHYDCKSGNSDVISRVLMLNGLRSRIPAGPITYIRNRSVVELKQYALRHGVRLADKEQFEQKEARLATPVFGDLFPSVSNPLVHSTVIAAKGKARQEKLGGILRFLEFEFWGEEPFTRLRRVIAATCETAPACFEAGVLKRDRDIILAYVLRHLVFALLSVASHVSYFSESDLRQSIQEWLITERLPVSELQRIIGTTVQLTYEIYGDPQKGPLRQDDYRLPPPEYLEELYSFLVRTMQLSDVMPWILPVYDALILESGVMDRAKVGQTIIAGCNLAQLEAAKRWLKGLRLFLVELGAMKDWPGWRLITDDRVIREGPSVLPSLDLFPTVSHPPGTDVISEKGDDPAKRGSSDEQPDPQR